MEAQDQQLPVFCVSNEWYEKCCPKGKTDRVKASRIPELRQYCRAIAADAWLVEAKHYLQSKMPALFTLLELWATSTNVALDHQIQAASGPVVDFAVVRRRLRILEDEVCISKKKTPTSLFWFSTNTTIRCLAWPERLRKILMTTSMKKSWLFSVRFGHLSFELVVGPYTHISGSNEGRHMERSSRH